MMIPATFDFDPSPIQQCLYISIIPQSISKWFLIKHVIEIIIHKKIS